MKKITIFIFSFVLVSCYDSGNSNTQFQTKKVEIDYQNSVDEFIAKHTATHDVFEFANNEVVQLAALSCVDETTTKFSIKTISKKNENVSELEGVAILKEGDVEIDEDEDGIGYPVNEYIYNENCCIAVRLALESKNLLRINSAECGDIVTESAPFISKGVLKKLN